MATVLQKQPMTAKSITSWLLTVGIPLAIMLIPTNELLTPQLRTYFALTVFAIMVFVFENMNTTAIAILLPISYVIIAKAPAAAVFAPWSTFVPWSVLGGLFFANIMERTGLLRRIAYHCILITGASYNGIIWGLALAGVALFCVIPGSTPFPMAALAYGICISLELGKSKESAGITIAAGFAALLPGLFIFNPSFFLLVGLGAPVAGPVSMQWFQYFYNNAVIVLFYILMFFILTKMFKTSKPISGKEYFKTELEKLGKLKFSEKKLLVIIAILFTFFLTTKYHGVDAAWGFAIFPLLAYFPGFNIGEKEDLIKVNYGMVLFTMGCMAIGTTAGALGLGKVVATVLVPMLQGKSITFILGTVFAGIFGVNFLMTPLAIMSAFTLPLTQIAVDFGINPAALYFFIQYAVDQIVLPYEYVLYLIFFSFGLISMKDFAKAFATKSIVAAIFFFAVVMPYWKLIGLLMLP